MDKRIIGTIVLIIAILLLGYLLINAPGTADENAVRATVEQFGQQLQKVSVLSPGASSTIATQYGLYVDPGLLARWEADPSQAPGRHTSSPWPDHIQITQVTQQAASYLVQGAEILKTSADTGNSYSGFVPIIAQVVKENGQWRVAAYQEIATSSASTTTAGFN